METTNQNQFSSRFGFLGKNTDIFMGFATMGILMVMVIPVPAIMMDLFLSMNITFALVIILVGMYVLSPLEFSAFPSILLMVTLFRLALNVATTRMILLHGNEGTLAAGKVIYAFGNFVVGGNYLVGVIVFLILVIVNFTVITKGAGRIAEVAARFTLDAMPGKQMSIDADLNAGLIDEHEARERRRRIAKESEYYGAMDGANKFVRGDAVAGIIITLINIIAGFAIGVFQNKMSFADAAQTYTLLTVGDGLVSQIPALIISTAAGIVVTRASSESNMGEEISRQILVQPRAIGVAAAILFGFALIPGLPTIPFFILAIIAGTISYVVFQTKKTKEAQEEVEAVPEEITDSTQDAFKPLPPLDVLSLEVGYGLIPLVDVDQDGELLERIKSIRNQIAQDIGIIVPSIHIQDNMQLKPGEYRVILKGTTLADGDMMLNHFMAMNPGTASGELDGISTKEPTYGLEAKWIREEIREKAISSGYTVVDIPTIVTTHLSDLIRRHAHELLGRQEAQKLLDYMKESHPKVVEELIPNPLSLGAVVKVLQNLLREQVPIRDLLTILETLADWAPMVRQTDVLTEYVRQALVRAITTMHQTPDGEIYVLTLDQNVEKQLADALQRTDQGNFLALDPNIAQLIMNNLAKKMEGFGSLNLQPVVLCSSQVRAHFKNLTDRYIPNLVVLAYDEILNSANIQVIGIVELSNAD